MVAFSLKKMKFLLIIFSLSHFLNAQENDLLDILNDMTIEEKCGQMTQVTFDAIEKEGFVLNQDPVDLEKLKIAIVDKHVGSILNTPKDIAQKGAVWQTIIKHIHDETLKTRLKIPVLYGIDSIHGANYIQEAVLFPQPLAQAASFNTEMAEKIGEIVAKETRATGIPWNFSPSMDIGRQPAWPRIWETYGEDVLLGQKLGESYIKGQQGNNLTDKTKVASCLKHYIGYGLPANGRDRTPAYIPENLLREYFLPPFESGLKAGSPTVMINSGEVNGLPGHANYHYLTEILKQELKFDGFAVSDWEDIIRLHTRDKVAETPEEAVRMAVMAGVDMSMVPFDFSFYDHCVSLSKKNNEFMKRANDAVLRILRVKKLIGILKHSNSIYPNAQDLMSIGSDASENIALEASRESIILAKNINDFLPLSKSSKILVVGPSANLLKVLNGGWSYKWQGNNETYFQTFSKRKHSTILQAIEKLSNGTVFYAHGVEFESFTETELILAENEALKSDIIVLCIGEDTYTETPGNIDNMMLSNSQMELADRLLKTGKKLILVYVGGRPRTITKIAKQATAVLIAFLPGNRGGDAIADIIFGEYNPNGRMPITYPKGPNGAMTYDYKPIENWETGLGEDVASYFDALYPFGHGLSYTSFSYSNLILDKTTIIEPESMTGSVTVTNNGSKLGKETVIVYLNDEYGSLTRPNKQMKFFLKIELRPGESKIVRFELTRYDMSFINLKNERIVESGKFNIFVDNLTASFQLSVTPTTTTTTTTITTITLLNGINSLKFNQVILFSLFILAFLF